MDTWVAGNLSGKKKIFFVSLSHFRSRLVCPETRLSFVIVMPSMLESATVYALLISLFSCSPVTRKRDFLSFPKKKVIVDFFFWIFFLWWWRTGIIVNAMAGTDSNAEIFTDRFATHSGRVLSVLGWRGHGAFDSLLSLFIFVFDWKFSCYN